MIKILEGLSFNNYFLKGVVYPAAGFGSIVSRRNVPIAEFNLDENPGCHTTT